VSVPLVQGLTLEQIRSCESFALAVWGTGFFDYSPTHHGQHLESLNAPKCLRCLEYVEQKPLPAPEQPKQPWELAA
jgi:hypothetical protein